MPDHDTGYKLLFSQKPMVADLLRGFVHESFVDRLDFDSLEKLSASYVSDKLDPRAGDLVWRLRWGDGDRWLYVYLLLEFQSTVDRFMAVRMMSYLALFYQDCIRQGWLTPEGRLPPVLPLVLYNGQRRWSAAQDVFDLLEPIPGALARYQPRLHYHLIDESALRPEDLTSFHNLVAPLFELERSRKPEEIGPILAKLKERLRRIGNGELERIYTLWVREVFLKARLPGVVVPEAQDLGEVETMLTETIIGWTEDWKRQGFEQGLQAGRQEGMQAGLQQSLKGLRSLLLDLLAGRFGAVPPSAHRRVEALDSVEELGRLIARAPQAPSLEALGLA